MTQYWIVGGEYSDTTFTRFRPGAQEQVFGPFPSYEDAHEEWQIHARATIDDATIRYRIFEGPPSEAEGPEPKP